MQAPLNPPGDLSQTVRLRNPVLYEAAQRETAKELPAGSRLYWKKTLEAYLELGGRTEPEQEEPT